MAEQKATRNLSSSRIRWTDDRTPNKDQTTENFPTKRLQTQSSGPNRLDNRVPGWSAVDEPLLLTPLIQEFQPSLEFSSISSDDSVYSARALTTKLSRPVLTKVDLVTPLGRELLTRPVWGCSGAKTWRRFWTGASATFPRTYATIGSFG